MQCHDYYRIFHNLSFILLELTMEVILNNEHECNIGSVEWKSVDCTICFWPSLTATTGLRFLTNCRFWWKTCLWGLGWGRLYSMMGRLHIVMSWISVTGIDAGPVSWLPRSLDLTVRPKHRQELNSCVELWMRTLRNNITASKLMLGPSRATNWKPWWTFWTCKLRYVPNAQGN